MLLEDALEMAKPCPFCGKKDALEMTDITQYHRMFEKNGDGNVAMRIGCERCGLDLFEHGYKKGIRGYTDRVLLTVLKWNERAAI